MIDGDDLTVRLAFLFDLLANGEMEKLTTTEILEFIEEQPTINPVKHGRWIEENRRPKSSQFYCSECHRIAYDIQPNRVKGWVKRCRYAFCPNCGAKMDGDDDETRNV